MRIQHKRGLKQNLPNTGLLPGELFLTTDRQTAHFAKDATTMAAIVPAIDELQTMPAITGSEDLLIMHDASENGVKEKKITFNAFKSALNIPEASTDEKVAVVAGGPAGYLYGDGTNGVLRGSASIVITQDASNAFVTLSVGTIDCGTF